MAKKLSKEEVLDKNNFHLTVGNLKKFIIENNISDDAPILVQRIEDCYFENNNWGLYPKHTAESNNLIHVWNKVYPNNKLTEDECETYKSGYIPTNCAVFHEDDKEILFIDLHY